MTAALGFGSAQKETSSEIYNWVDKWKKRENILGKSDQPKPNTDV